MAPTTTLATHEWAPTDADPADAPVAVLVHGVTGWHRTWWRVGPALAERGWRAVAVDQRGHGRSPRIDGFTTIGELAADLAATIERIGPPVAALIGHSTARRSVPNSPSCDRSSSDGSSLRTRRR
jgi:pimeloyl-ACP methyl ester carboxylesterase